MALTKYQQKIILIIIIFIVVRIPISLVSELESLFGPFIEDLAAGKVLYCDFKEYL